jgi:two-component sensor histidine kinase
VHRAKAGKKHGGIDKSRAGRRRQDPLESARRSETLLREVHHRVKNNLQIVASLLTMQSSTATNATVRLALSEAVTRISTIALIHDQLCEAPTATTVDMRAFVEELVGNVRRTFSDPAVNIVTTIDVAPLSLGLQLATPCGLIISELVTNAFQHAFLRTDRGEIAIRLAANRRWFTLVVQDTGRGLPADAESPVAKGLGLHLVRLLATRQLRGRLTIARRHGTTFTVRVPLASGGQLSRPVRHRHERKAS